MDGALLPTPQIADIPSTISAWGQDLLDFLAVTVGLPPGAKIKVVIKYAEDGEEVQLKGKARDWKTIQGLDPADVIIVIPPPPAAPIICHCTHADCYATPPGFTKIEELEEHYMQNHSSVSASGGGGETVAAIFTHTEDATTPAWRRRVLQDTHSFENSRIRGEKAANIAMDIVPVRRVAASYSILNIY